MKKHKQDLREAAIGYLPIKMVIPNTESSMIHVCKILLIYISFSFLSAKDKHPFSAVVVM